MNFRVRTNIKSAREKGSGLGLAYVKEIIKTQGDIHLESNDEFGSKFTIVLLRNFAELNNEKLLILFIFFYRDLFMLKVLQLLSHPRMFKMLLRYTREILNC